MGVKIYRCDNWNRLRNGVVSGHDILGLDRDLDRCLFEWLLLHLSESKRKKVMEKYKITRLPEEEVNVDLPSDEAFRTYPVLLEQVRREEDLEVLKTASYRKERDDISRFAFCRLTGFSWPPEECDAYSYRTFRCGLAPGLVRRDIEDFCTEMIKKQGPYAKEAADWLLRLREISDVRQLQ